MTRSVDSVRRTSPAVQWLDTVRRVPARRSNRAGFSSVLSKGKIMDAYTNEYRLRQSGEAQLVVLPASSRYGDQMERCHQVAYGYVPSPDDVEALTAAKFRQHLRIFPEGQFMALDIATDSVIGTTSNMRLNFDLHKRDVRSWAEITNDG
jgi:hypothetical protein